MLLLLLLASWFRPSAGHPITQSPSLRLFWNPTPVMSYSGPGIVQRGGGAPEVKVIMFPESRRRGRGCVTLLTDHLDYSQNLPNLMGFLMKVASWGLNLKAIMFPEWEREEKGGCRKWLISCSNVRASIVVNRHRCCWHCHRHQDALSRMFSLRKMFVKPAPYFLLIFCEAVWVMG